MRLFRRKKSMWQRAVEPVADRVDARALTRSGLAAAAGAIGLTAASAVVSSVRRRNDR